MGLDKILNGQVTTEDAERAVELAAVYNGVHMAAAGDDVVRVIGARVGTDEVAHLVKLGDHAQVLKLLLEGELCVEPFGREEQAGHATGLIGAKGCEPIADRFHFLCGGAHIYTPYYLVEDRLIVWCVARSVR